MMVIVDTWYVETNLGQRAHAETVLPDTLKAGTAFEAITDTAPAIGDDGWPIGPRPGDPVRVNIYPGPGVTEDDLVAFYAGHPDYGGAP